MQDDVSTGTPVDGAAASTPNTPDASGGGSYNATQGEPKADLKRASADGYRAGEAKGREAAKRELLAELGLDQDDQRDAFLKWREDAEKQKPALERLQRQWAKEKETLSSQLADLQKLHAEQTEANMKLFLNKESEKIARELDAFSSDDIYEFIDARVETDSEDDGKIDFVDGKVKVSLHGEEAFKQIAKHLQKVRPHWFRTTRSSGAGTGVGRSPTLSAANGKTGTMDDLASEMAKDIVSGLRK